MLKLGLLQVVIPFLHHGTCINCIHRSFSRRSALTVGQCDYSLQSWKLTVSCLKCRNRRSIGEPKFSVTGCLDGTPNRTSLPKKLLAASNMIARSQPADTTVVPTSHGHRRGFGPAQVRMPFRARQSACRGGTMRE